MITGVQIRTARRMLNWAPASAAKHARVSVDLITEAEGNDIAYLPSATAEALRRSFERQGLEFRDDPARPVRWCRRNAPGSVAWRQSA